MIKIAKQSGKDLNTTTKIKKLRILNTHFADFWSKAKGWAPDEANELLSVAQLQWQVSLTDTLHIWAAKGESITDGELILAWANLGSLLEGNLKLFFAVWYKDYQKDIEVLKKTNAFDHKKQTHKAPDGLSLEPLRNLAVELKLFPVHLNETMKLIQDRRNVIHAFKPKPLGDFQEFDLALGHYLDMVVIVENRLPYPHHPHFQ